MGALKKRRRGCCTASSCSWVKTTMGGCLKAVDRPKNVGKTENISQQYRTNSYIPIDCQWYSIQKTHFSFIIIDWTMCRYYGTITINTTSNSLLWIYLDLFGAYISRQHFHIFLVSTTALPISVYLGRPAPRTSHHHRLPHPVEAPAEAAILGQLRVPRIMGYIYIYVYIYIYRTDCVWFYPLMIMIW
jgi:hypothetical protein